MIFDPTFGDQFYQIVPKTQPAPGLTPTYYTTGIAQPTAVATPVAVEVILKPAQTFTGVLACKITIFLPDPPAVAVPAVAPAADLSGLSSLASLLPSLKALTAQATAKTPATLGALNNIQGATLSLLNKVPIETIPIALRADIATLIAATQQLGALNQQTKALNQAELDKVIAASNNLLAALPA